MALVTGCIGVELCWRCDALVWSEYNPDDDEIAVGTVIADCPPRGPGRALISASGSYRG